MPFAPDIAVEALSPSEGFVEVNRKALEYLEAGCQEVWILDTKNSEVFVRTLGPFVSFLATAALDSPLLPGFFQTVGDLLAW